ncbi:44L [Yaba monkey tumor virus]|uniref:44L n=1 Tax=Yaba monkey tumor virus (strain VR587) TaxID=928314 RepID=Q6TUW9_YMTV5|nr:putative transmembrane protein [Yaba monkey tumor virus]AAR07400.1 44L [Yaba monkey tumor virus]
MDKLYTAIFGAFLSSEDEDFNNFIDVVRSVLTDDNIASKNVCSSGTKIWIITIIFVVLAVFLTFLYLKAVPRT